MAYLGEEIRKLGFGMMRLPKNGDEIDIETTKKMVDRFLEAGFTYFDTAWLYNGSEEAVRKALVERYPRESYQLATKLSAWYNCQTREDAIHQFEVSLERTGAGYFDFYLMHNLGDPRTHFYDDFKLWDFALEMKAAGKIRHLGFSYHGQADELKAILEAHPEVEFVQLQINYADWEDNVIQSRKNYEVVRSFGKSLVIMEPVKGGLLANPPEVVKDIFRAEEPDMSPASWAVRFAASMDGLIAVLSGMSTPEQVEDNLATMKDFTRMSEKQLDTIRRAQEAMAQIPIIPCTSCNYCAKVCPMNIGISGSFTAQNQLTLYGNLEMAKSRMKMAVINRGKATADNCIGCGACMEACPQRIEIPERLKEVRENFGL